MSWAFVTSLKKNPQQSYVQLLNSIRDELATKYTQKPQLSCSHPLSECPLNHTSWRIIPLTVVRHEPAVRYVNQTDASDHVFTAEGREHVARLETTIPWDLRKRGAARDGKSAPSLYEGTHTFAGRCETGILCSTSQRRGLVGHGASSTGCLRRRDLGLDVLFGSAAPSVYLIGQGVVGLLT